MGSSKKVWRMARIHSAFKIMTVAEEKLSNFSPVYEVFSELLIIFVDVDRDEISTLVRN